MATPLTAEAVTRVLAQAISDAWTATPLGASEALAPGTSADGVGWTVTVPASGAASGRLVVWFERATAVACATRALGLDAEAPTADVVPVLTQLVTRAVAAAETSPDAAGLTMGDPTVEEGAAPAQAQPFVATWAGTLQCRFAVAATLSSAAMSSAIVAGDDSRLEAVLDVDLPLVVRFGRAVMPLRSVADLSPGSVVDMGRSPDEPVELLVGERLIARGEVVIVGGNYGVRITELTNGRRSTDLEARS
jgi:flagellar motor switch protein FliN